MEKKVWWTVKTDCGTRRSLAVSARKAARNVRYRLVMDTDETRFGGQGRIAAGQMFFTEATVENHERVDRVKLYLPARTALVLEFLAPGVS